MNASNRIGSDHEPHSKGAGRREGGERERAESEDEKARIKRGRKGDRGVKGDGGRFAKLACTTRQNRVLMSVDNWNGHVLEQSFGTDNK